MSPVVTSELEVMFWCYLDADTDKAIIGTWQASGGGTDSWLIIINYSGADTFAFFGVSTTGSIDSVEATGIEWPTTTWFHVRLSFEAGSFKLWLDDVVVYSGTVSMATLRSTALPIWVGRYNSVYGKFVIDDLRIHRTVLPFYASQLVYADGAGSEEDSFTREKYTLFADATIDGYIENVASLNGTIEVAAVIRQKSDYSWEIIEDTSHGKLNIVNIFGSESDGEAFVSVFYSFTATKVLTFIAAPDEHYAQNGVACGATVGLTYSKIKFGRNGVALSESALWSYGGSSANVWIYGKFEID